MLRTPIGSINVHVYVNNVSPINKPTVQDLEMYILFISLFIYNIIHAW